MNLNLQWNLDLSGLINQAVDLTITEDTKIGS